MSTRLVLALPVLAVVSGCSYLKYEAGSVQICLVGHQMGGEDVEIRASGNITALEVGVDAPADCFIEGPATLLTVTEPDDGTTTVAFAVRDAEGNDATPSVDLALFADVDLLFRERLVWGTVSGLVLSDAEGVIAAFEEGTWGGALDDADVPGLTVRNTDTRVGEQHGECGVTVGHSLEFDADEVVEVTPFDSAPIEIDGAAYTAMAVANWSWTDNVSCTDMTDATSWAVFR